MQFSQKLANLIASGVDVRSAASEFIRHIYSGAMPATADSAINGTLLAKLTKDGAAATYETLPAWKITIGGSMGGTVTIKLGACAIHAAVTSITDATTTAALLVTAINGTLLKAFSGFTASSTGADLFVYGPKGSGTSLNTMVCTTAVTSSVTATVAGDGTPADSGGTAGVAAVNCCDYDARSVIGVLTTTQTWKDTSADASGTATWYRDVYATADTGTATTAYIRKQGTITGIGGGGDMEMTNTVVTAGTPVEGTAAGSFTIPST